MPPAKKSKNTASSRKRNAGAGGAANTANSSSRIVICQHPPGLDYEIDGTRSQKSNKKAFKNLVVDLRGNERKDFERSLKDVAGWRKYLADCKNRKKRYVDSLIKDDRIRVRGNSGEFFEVEGIRILRKVGDFIKVEILWPLEKCKLHETAHFLKDPTVDELDKECDDLRNQLKRSRKKNKRQAEEIKKLKDQLKESKRMNDGGHQEEEIDGDQEEEIDGDQEEEIDGDQEEESDGDQEEEIDGDQEEESDGDQEEESDGDQEEEIDGDQEEESDGDQEEESDGDQEEEIDGDQKEDINSLGDVLDHGHLNDINIDQQEIGRQENEDQEMEDQATDNQETNDFSDSDSFVDSENSVPSSNNASRVQNKKKMPMAKLGKAKPEKYWNGHMGANLISSFNQVSEIGVEFENLWYEGRVKVSEDFSKALLDVMLKEQFNNSGSLYDPISKGTSEACEALMKRSIRAHYVGWSKHTDETVDRSRILINKADQIESRKRFLSMTNGKDLWPETLARFEFKYQHWGDKNTKNAVKKQFSLEQLLILARAALDWSHNTSSSSSASSSSFSDDDDDDDDDDGNADAAEEAEGPDDVEEADADMDNGEGSDNDGPKDIDSVDDDYEVSEAAEEAEEPVEEADGGDMDDGKDSEDYGNLQEMDQVFEAPQGNFHNELIEEELENPPAPDVQQAMEVDAPVLPTTPSLESTSNSQIIPCLTPEDTMSSSGSPLADEPTTSTSQTIPCLTPEDATASSIASPLADEPTTSTSQIISCLTPGNIVSSGGSPLANEPTTSTSQTMPITPESIVSSESSPLPDEPATLPPLTIKVEVQDNRNTEISEEEGGVQDSDEPPKKRQRLADELEFSNQPALPLQQHRAVLPPFTSEASLEMQQSTESSSLPEQSIPVTVPEQDEMSPTAPEALNREFPSSPSNPELVPSESPVTSFPATLVRQMEEEISAKPLVGSTPTSGSSGLSKRKRRSPEDEVEEDIVQTKKFLSNHQQSASTTSRDFNLADLKFPTNFEEGKAYVASLYDSRAFDKEEDRQHFGISDIEEVVRARPEEDRARLLEEKSKDLQKIHAKAKADWANLEKLERRWKRQQDKKKANEGASSSTTSSDM